MAGIREAKAELKGIRSRLSEMNPTQLANFFKPFSPAKLTAIRKAVEKAIDSKTQVIIDVKMKQIAKLSEEVSELEMKKKAKK